MFANDQQEFEFRSRKRKRPLKSRRTPYKSRLRARQFSLECKVCILWNCLESLESESLNSWAAASNFWISSRASKARHSKYSWGPQSLGRTPFHSSKSMRSLDEPTRQEQPPCTCPHQSSPISKCFFPLPIKRYIKLSCVCGIERNMKMCGILSENPIYRARSASVDACDSELVGRVRLPHNCVLFR